MTNMPPYFHTYLDYILKPNERVEVDIGVQRLHDLEKRGWRIRYTSNKDRCKLRVATGSVVGQKKYCLKLKGNYYVVAIRPTISLREKG